MMRKLSTVIVMLVFLFRLAPVVHGASIFFGPGCKSNGMGIAFVAVADDLTAIYWNPAGLTQLEGSGIDTSFLYISADSKSNKSLGNAEDGVLDRDNGDFVLPNIYGSSFGNIEPIEYNNKIFKASAVLPFAGGYKKINDITLAGGFYGIGGGGGEWSDTVSDITGTDTINASVKGGYSLAIVNLSAAKNINPKLSIGIGLNYVIMLDKLTAKKSYVQGVGSLVPDSYALLMEKNASGSGLAFNIGALYAVNDKMNVGLAIRNGSKLKVKGKAKFTQSGFSNLSVAYPTIFSDVNHETDYDQDYYYPTAYEIGISYKPQDSLTLGFSISRVCYSVMKDKVTYDSNAIFANTDTSLRWKDITEIHFGADYRVDDKLTLRAGIFNDPDQCPTDKYTILNTNHYTQTIVVLGVEYSISQWRLAVNYARLISNKPSSNDGRTFEMPGSVVILDVGYKF